jgi:hypothetical protein
VLIAANDRPALERLLRHCARLEVAGQGGDVEQCDERIRYTLPKPGPEGQTSLLLTPLELLDQLAALIPPPRRHHYHGAFAPHSLRLIALITQPAAIGSILTRISEPITPPPLAPRARAPPEFEDTEQALTLDQSLAWNLAAPSPEPRFEFNQEQSA